jgi:hypothetical protein
MSISLNDPWVQAVLVVGLLLLVWFAAFAFFMVSFAIGGEHMRRQRTDDPDDDWYK